MEWTCRVSTLRKAREIVWREAGDRKPVLWTFIVNGVFASTVIPNRIRVQLYRLVGLDIDRTAVVRPGVFFRSENVSIGASTVVGYRVVFDTRQPLTIGERVAIGPSVTFVDSDHEMSDPQRRAGKTVSAPIRIGDGARISTGSVVLPGVTVGEGAAVGAQSLVKHDCEPHTLYVGSPARALRPLPV